MNKLYLEIKKYNEENKIEVKYEDFTAIYTVTQNDEEGLPSYGIKVSCGDLGTETLENIFFTEAEAYKRCEWLAENEVFAQGFKNVMEDIMV